MKTDNNLLTVVTQGFYGNKTITDIKRENVEKFILGYIDNSIEVTEKTDKTIVRVPNTENIVIVYNKYAEEEAIKNNKLKPLAIIPEEDLKIYSRCIVCRIGLNGEFKSLQNTDYEKFMKYLAD